MNVPPPVTVIGWSDDHSFLCRSPQRSVVPAGTTYVCAALRSFTFESAVPTSAHAPPAVAGKTTRPMP